MKFHNFALFYQFYQIVDMTSALACRVESIKHTFAVIFPNGSCSKLKKKSPIRLLQYKPKSSIRLLLQYKEFG